MIGWDTTVSLAVSTTDILKLVKMISLQIVLCHVVYVLWEVKMMIIPALDQHRRAQHHHQHQQD